MWRSEGQRWILVDLYASRTTIRLSSSTRESAVDSSRSRSVPTDKAQKLALMGREKLTLIPQNQH